MAVGIKTVLVTIQGSSIISIIIQAIITITLIIMIKLVGSIST